MPIKLVANPPISILVVVENTLIMVGIMSTRNGQMNIMEM